MKRRNRVGERCSPQYIAGVLGVALLALGAPVPAHAAGGLTSPSGYIEYVATSGDIYNGVTTDDGEDLPGSYIAKGRIEYARFAALLRFRRDASQSQANALTSSGGPATSLAFPTAQVVVPQFTAVDSEFEARLEYQPLHIPVYVGLAYARATNNYGFPALQAVGFGLELTPNPHHLISPYGSYFFFPNQTGVYALANPNDPSSGTSPAAYRANELEIGLSLAIPKTDLTIDGGYSQSTNVSRLGAFNFVRSAPYLGVGYRLR